MSNDFNDDIAGIFDHLTPDMFVSETSAVDESEGSFRGVAAFDASVDERIRGIRSAFASSFGQINPIAVLTNATVQRVFVPEQDENLGMFLERLQREARMMGAHWFFFAKRNIVSVYYPDDDDVDGERHDVASDASEAEAMRRGSEPTMGILWYAERREGEEIHHRHGVLEFEGNRITKATEGDGQQTIGVFSVVLDVVTR